MQQLKRNGGVKMMRAHRSTISGIVGVVLMICLVASGAFAYDGEENAIVRLSAAADSQERLHSLDLEMGKSAYVRTDFNVKRVSVGSPKILEVVVLSPREVQLVPQKKGTTNLIFWGAKGDPAAIVDVSIGNSFTVIERKLRSILGSDNIQVEAVGEGIVLRGSVGGPIHVERASAIARSFFAEDGEDKVVNTLEVGGNQQVMIEVVIAEMQRTLGRRLTTNWSAAVRTGSKLFTFDNLLGNLVGLDERTVSFPPPSVVSELNFSERIDLVGTFINNGSFAFNSFIELATERGLAKVLAKPTLLARSGQKASFLAGGEVPIPIAQGGAFGSITIEFKQFGVGVEFAPTVLGEDRIHLEVSPEVSEPDFTIGTSTGGVFTPGFITRRASTSVELADGQSFAIAGLLSERMREFVERVPVLGDIPVLGALFRSQDYQRDETELVLIVTPRLVKPLTGELQLPTDSFVDPEDWEFYLLGALEHQRRGKHRSVEDETATLIGPSGYRLPVAMEEEVR
jgi:pilus assembly protein CpaC